MNKKKLNNNKSEYNDNSIDDTLTLKAKMDKASNVISNKEALRDKIHEIHNYLRNNGVGYGMNALKVFNIIYGLKKIEDNNLLEKVNLDPICKFSHLLKLAKENEDEQLTWDIFGPVLTSISKSKIREVLFYEIPKKIKAYVLSHLVKEINEISLIEEKCNVLLSGKIYEYFIGRDESAISELGAYFTDRHIVDYILKKLDPSKNEDCSIPTMIDMFGGSGGFTTGYIKYLKDKYPNSINWKTEIDKIYHYDMNHDVVKSAGLELFCLTGEFPNTDTNLKYKNSFTDNFCDNKFKYPITNPPYGGDKNNKSDAQFKREKVKKYILNELKNINNIEENKDLIERRKKQLKNIDAQEKRDTKISNKQKVCVGSCSPRIQKFSYVNKLNGNDKESCSLMLLMDIVEKGGTAIGVLKEGVFFNKAYKNLRKYLIENYNVRDVISVPSDQFENTSTKTSILIFDNTEEKTSKVKFSELIVERYTEDKFDEVLGDIYLVENKGDIKEVNEKLIVEVNKEDILKNLNYSLNGKDYNKKDLIPGKGFELVKLGDICESQNGFAFKKVDYKKKGVPLITIKHIKDEKILFNNDNYIEENDNYKNYEIKKDDIVISLTGKKPRLCSIAINNKNHKQYLNQRCAILRNFKKINNYYFSCIFNGVLLDYINKYIGYGSNQENVSLSDILNLKIPLPKSGKKIKEWVKKITKPYNEKNEKQEKVKELEEYVQNRIKEISEDEDCDVDKLSDLCEFKPKSKRKASYGKEFGKYNFYTSSDKIKKCDEADYDEECLIIGTGGLANIKIDNKFSCSGDNFIVKSRYNYYLYYMFKGNMNLLSDGFTGSVLKHLSKEYLKNIKIKIPKNKQLIKDLEPTFKQIETLHKEVKEAYNLYKQLIQELKEEAIVEETTEANETNKSNETNEISNDESEKSNEENYENEELEKTTNKIDELFKPKKKKKKIVKKKSKNVVNNK